MSMIQKQVEDLRKLQRRYFNPNSSSWNVVEDAIDTINCLSEKLRKANLGETNVENTNSFDSVIPEVVKNSIMSRFERVE